MCQVCLGPPPAMVKVTTTVPCGGVGELGGVRDAGCRSTGTRSNILSGTRNDQGPSIMYPIFWKLDAGSMTL